MITQELITYILGIITIINAIVTWLNSGKRSVEQQVKVNMKLDEICRATSETSTDIKAMRQTQANHEVAIGKLNTRMETLEKQMIDDGR